MKTQVIVVILLIGIGLGVVGTIFGPEVAGPYLPETFRGY